MMGKVDAMNVERVVMIKAANAMKKEAMMEITEELPASEQAALSKEISKARGSGHRSEDESQERRNRASAVDLPDDDGVNDSGEGNGGETGSPEAGKGASQQSDDDEAEAPSVTLQESLREPAALTEETTLREEAALDIAAMFDKEDELREKLVSAGDAEFSEEA